MAFGRCFYPAYGIPEDPVTGSAHCLSAPYWAEKLDKSTLLARQLSARGGEVQCTVANGRVALSGEARSFLVGQLVPLNKS